MLSIILTLLTLSNAFENSTIINEFPSFPPVFFDENHKTPCNCVCEYKIEVVPAIRVPKIKQEEFEDPWALTPDEVIPYDLLPDELYISLYDNGGYSPGCPGATTEHECIWRLGCSWCPWNNMGCIYKDVADLLPIPIGNDLCRSATQIGGDGEPEDYHLFWFHYGRYEPPKISRT